MNPAPTARPPARPAVELAKHVPLSPDAKALLTPGQSVRQFFDALAAAPLPDDAIRFLAAALPKREAVWWGCVCVKETLAAPAPPGGTDPPPPTAGKAIAAAERWVRDPVEANRRAAGDAATAAGYGTPAGLVVAGAFWSGGSLAPPDVAPVPPPDDLTGTAVAGAILLACLTYPDQIPATKLRFLHLGTDIAAGKARW